MIAASGGVFALVFLTGVTTLFLHRVSDVVEDVADGPVSRMLAFFGVGDLPVLFAGGLFAAVTGAGGMAHAGLAHATLAGQCPPWYPALATLSAAALGLAALGLATGTSGRTPKKKKAVPVKKRS